MDAEQHTCTQVIIWMTSGFQGNEPPDPPDAVVAHIASCEYCRGALVALIQTLSSIRQFPSHLGDCDLCVADIPAFIELEAQSTVEAVRAFPHVWWHLLLCEGCREVYESTRSLINAELVGLIPPMPRTVTANDTRTTFPNIRINVPLSFLEPVLSLADFGPVRGSQPEGYVVYEQSDITPAAHELIIQLHEQADHLWTLIIQTRPPIPARVQVQIGSNNYSEPFSADGVARVKNLARSVLSDPQTPDMSIEIEPA